MKSKNKLLNLLTIEEKAALIEGNDSWNTNGVPRLDIPKLFLTDGPHGLRKVRTVSGGFGISDNAHSTAFPTSVTVASSWNPEHARRMGEAIAEECIAEEVDVLLAPGVNIKRSPLCGRNFEYYSEDPLISGDFGTAFVQGVQSKGVGCSVKHFAANSNENYRFVGNSVVDERALREIYLRAFESVVKKAKPYTVMCSYNQLNGTFASQNQLLLSSLLRDEWGFDGVVMTDWGATCDRVEGVLAGCDLDMPGGVWHNRKSIIEGTLSGRLPISKLDQSVERILTLVDRCASKKSKANGDILEAHAQLSCEIAKEGAVLLKNDGTLPLSGKEKLLVVGEMFEKMRYQGAGSSLINPPRVITPKNAFDERGIPYIYEKGFRCFYTDRDFALEQAALDAAKEADTILFFGGLSDFEESEGFDREHMVMGDNQTKLLDALIATGKKVVLVLFTGAPVELPFFDRLSSMLNMYLPGMYGGEAAAALLYGEVTPSGKLAESWPMSARDTSCYADYNLSAVSQYYESIYVGYRFYDKAGTKLRFPFGFGLSYSSFHYSNLSIKQHGNEITVMIDVTNNGNFSGSEIVQLYVRNNKSKVFKADKELRAFRKEFLAVGETQTIEMKFDQSDLSYWNVKEQRWVLENGSYEIAVAASAADIRLTAQININGGEEAVTPYSDEILAAYDVPPLRIPSVFADLTGHTDRGTKPEPALSLESSLFEFKRSLMGRLLFASVMYVIQKDYKKALAMPDSLERDTRLKNSHFVVKMMPYNSIRSMCMSSGGKFTYQTAIGFVELANGNLIRGLKTLLKKEKPLPLPGE
ncbi:glycoside hydrolase family 3 C-terminal domain-containing protein [Paenibacillus sp. NFR01]|uniref:glycoside hydrolase family 3 C-terminal domain-containing protein n=1 Tax=Paenibacillus sp. NFR01 TaxID=1566279 RepID=UPI0008B8F77C|nr:glycoside hydrolase family 3 C-terminal domain-containing protein [Paenibacillus sp. NFR01]SET03992.1 beta-glucosidase [Paenibacillus sp. NFR01]